MWSKVRDEEEVTAAPASWVCSLSVFWGRKTSPVVVVVVVARLLCPSEDLKDRLVEVIGLVGKNVMSCPSDHLQKTRTVCLARDKTWIHVLFFTHPDFHIWSGFLERKSWVTVDAGSRTVDEGDRNVSLDLPDPLQHGSLRPSVRYGHVPEGCLSTETPEQEALPQVSSVPLNGCSSCLALTLESGRSDGKCNRTRCCPQTPTSISAWSPIWWSEPTLDLRGKNQRTCTGLRPPRGI